MRHRPYILTIFTIFGLIQAFVVCCQHIGFLESRNALFPVTGFAWNPGLMGGLQAICFLASVLVLKHFSKTNRWLRILLMGSAAFILYSIISSESRAAVFSVLVGLYFIFYDKLKPRSVLIAACISVSAILSYFIRPASAQARLLVWRVSSGMIADKPLLGFGYDGFRQNYMLYQADYFRTHPDSSFAEIAGNAAYPYNELIRLAVENGIPCALFILLLLLLVFVREKDKQYLAPLAAYCTFAMFSYPSYWLPLLIAFVLCLSVCQNSRIASVILTLAIFAGPILHSDRFGRGIDHPNYEWSCARGDTLLTEKKYEEAERSLIEASLMTPKKLKPDFLLWRLYSETGDRKKAEERALKVLEKSNGRCDTYSLKAKAEVLLKEGETFKYRKFIKDNLPYHTGWGAIELSDEVEKLFSGIDTISINPTAPERITFAREWKRISADEGLLYKRITDTLSDEDINRNIEYALSLWKDGKFAKGLSEEDFMEMILPFVTATEKIQVDKQSVSETLLPLIGVENAATTNDAIKSFSSFFSRCWYYTKKVKAGTDNLGYHELMMPTSKSGCYDATAVSCDVLRAVGIPVTMEFTPKWPDRAKGHYWCSVPDSCGILRPFTPPTNQMMGDWDPYLQGAGKVYRLNYSKQNDCPASLARRSEYIPSGLRSPLISDRTSHYRKTVTLSLPFRENTKNSLAYLCHFSNDEDGLIPVAWGEIDHRKGRVTFRHVPAGVVFFPAYFKYDELIPFGSPLVVNEKGIARFSSQPMTVALGGKYREFRNVRCRKFPVANSTSTMVLTRKYPDKSRLRSFRSDMVGTCLLGSMERSGPFDTLLVFDKMPEPYLQQKDLNISRSYRYFTLISPEKKPINIAHIEFLGECDDSLSCRPTPLPVFSPDDVNNDDKSLHRLQPELAYRTEDILKAIDGDIETYSTSRKLTFVFPAPTIVKAIRFAPRNANNIVNAGDTYSLFYYDRGWKLHSSSVASENYLVFEDVPSRTLYWLSDETKGKEELPFMYKKGKQIFINEL